MGSMAARRRVWPRVVIASVVVGALAAGMVLQWDWVRTRAVDAVDQGSRWSTRLRATAADLPEAELEARALTVASASALVVIGSGDGDAAFALLAAAPSGPPALIILPPSMLLSVPLYPEFRLLAPLL